MLDGQKHAAKIFRWLLYTNLMQDCGIVTWLSLAAGLKSVAVDISVLDPSVYLCHNAQKYDDAASASMSSWQLELTRLLYLYCSLESFFTEVASRSCASNGVGAGLKEYLEPSLARHMRHESRCVDHLSAHVKRELPHDQKLSRILNRQGDPIPNRALQLGLEFRHLFAHAKLKAPTPIQDDDGNWVDGSDSIVCMVKEASSCLLLSLQRLLYVATQRGDITHHRASIEIDDGIWVPEVPYGDSFAFELEPADYIMSLHIEEGIYPDDYIEGQLNISQA